MTAAKQEHKLASYKEYAERWHPSLGVVEIWRLVVHTVFLPGGLKCVAKLNLRQKCKEKWRSLRHQQLAYIDSQTMSSDNVYLQ